MLDSALEFLLGITGKEQGPDKFTDLCQAHIVEIRMSTEIWIRGARLTSYSTSTGE